jgi:hypothetical protein
MNASGSPLAELAEPRFASRNAFLVAGLSVRYDYENGGGIPAQWQRFGPYRQRAGTDRQHCVWGALQQRRQWSGLSLRVEVGEFSQLGADQGMKMPGAGNTLPGLVLPKYPNGRAPSRV